MSAGIIGGMSILTSCHDHDCRLHSSRDGIGNPHIPRKEFAASGPGNKSCNSIFLYRMPGSDFEMKNS
jgi:hypothetical protein